MILPIVAYGDPVLRKVADAIDAAYPDLEKLINSFCFRVWCVLE